MHSFLTYEKLTKFFRSCEKRATSIFFLNRKSTQWLRAMANRGMECAQCQGQRKLETSSTIKKQTPVSF